VVVWVSHLSFLMWADGVGGDEGNVKRILDVGCVRWGVVCEHRETNKNSKY
jgi:hypothetical protein